MMREILFRGKRKSNGEWIYGYFVGEDSDAPFVSPPVKAEIIIQKGTGWWVSVEPKTVGQYTGLTDKDGNKIFEGDIVRYNCTLHEVVFCAINGCAFFGITMPERGEIWNFDGITDAERAEIVGNIHDNPELIGGNE